MTGNIKGRLVNFYPQIIEGDNGKKSTHTVIEVFLNQLPDTVCVVASGGFVDFVTVLDLPEPFTLDHARWPRGSLARTFEDESPDAWFLENQDRIMGIDSLFKLPFEKAFFTDVERSFLVIRTANPLSDPKRLNQVVGKLFEIATMLESQAIIANPKDESETESEAPSIDAPTE